MPYRTLALLCTATLATLAGCQPTIDPANREPTITPIDPARVFATDREHYSRGDTVQLVLTNRTEQMVGYNLCVSVLEHRLEEGWATAPHQEDRVCTLELRTLDPGETATFPWDLDPRLPAGVYRYRNHFEIMPDGEREEFTTNEFVLEG